MIADLWRYYGVDLADMYAGRIRVGIVAALVEHLPSGSAVGREFGGAAARSDEWHAIAQLDYTVRQIAGGKDAKPWQLPEGVREREAREAREEAKKAAFRANAERRDALRAQGKLTLRDV